MPILIWIVTVFGTRFVNECFIYISADFIVNLLRVTWRKVKSGRNKGEWKPHIKITKL
jgi:hypothetical protein